MAVENGVRHGHFSIALSYLERQMRDAERDGEPQTAFTHKGKAVSYAEAYQHLAALRAKGHEWITDAECDNVQPDGSCGMHDGPAPKG
jgi:hypothetical protein